MSERPQKHSLTIRQHQTSVSLENEFWQALRNIASDRGISVNALAAEIDEQRGMDMGLASAIRLYILRFYIALADSGQSR